MAGIKKSIEILEALFATGQIPVGQNFADWLASFLHKDESKGTQLQVNAGVDDNNFVTAKKLADRDGDALALVDGATINITGEKHTLATALGRTFTNSYLGEVAIINITLAAASATFTFPVGYLCSYAGVASGDNTLVVTGATSGDLISVVVLKVGGQYLVSGQNFGQ